MSVVGAVAASLLGVVVVGRLRSDDVTPVPPHTLAMLSEHGLDGDPVPVTGAVALATGAGWLWAADEKDDALVRIDPGVAARRADDL